MDAILHRLAWPESRRELVPVAKSLNVAIDGTYLRADGRMWLREYQVVAGRMERQGELGDYFAWVPQHRLCLTTGFHEGGAGSQRLDIGLESEGAG